MSPVYQAPGVYVEEKDSGNKPIETVGTSVVGFLGMCSRGPVNTPQMITNWAQYTNLFGDFEHSKHLSHALYGFFANGGSRCYVTNVGDGKEDKKPAFKSDGKEGDGKNSHASSSTDGSTDALFLGEDKGPGARSGVKTFNEIDDISIVVAPGQTSAAVHDALLSHCENMKDRFAILDSPQTINGLDKMYKPRDSKYGAYYFPWLKVYDPFKKKEISVPPSGHLAGLYGFVDGTRGVHKAPANEIVRGALGLEYNISQAEQELLNPKGINCIREFTDRGIRVWGGRTISSDPEWRYINIRRLFIMVEKSIQKGTDWVVFEPNDQKLWKKITRNITALLLRIWKDGALFGTTPEQAFYVKCDSETNPPEVIDAGQCVIEIGIAPVKPAEFVIFRISQKSIGDDE
jgi:Bacteriophage tail sheath protein